MDIKKQSEFLSLKWRKYQQNEDKIISASDNSVCKIEAYLNISLPPEYILLSQVALNYRAWFAGIGEDYTSLKHILVINQHSVDDESLPIPEGYIAINQGFDDDFDCVKANTSDSGVYYFDADINYGGSLKKIADDFQDYLRVIAT